VASHGAGERRRGRAAGVAVVSDTAVVVALVAVLLILVGIVVARAIWRS